MLRVVLTFAVFFLLTGDALRAQNLTALEIVRKTIKASGGETWRRPKTLRLSGTANLYWNGKNYEMKTYRMWRVFPAQNDSARDASGKVRFDALMPDGRPFFRISFDGKNSSRELSKEAKEQEELLRWGNNFGFSIFRFADRSDFKLTRLPDDRIDGNTCYFIKITDARKRETIFGVDKSKFFIRYAGFKTPIGFHERIYSSFKWHRSPKFIQPQSLRVFVDGVKIADVFWRDFEVNRRIPDRVFDSSEFAKN